MVKLVDTDLETDSIKIITIASPIVFRGRWKDTLYGAIIWEIEFKHGF